MSSNIWILYLQVAINLIFTSSDCTCCILLLWILTFDVLWLLWLFTVCNVVLKDGSILISKRPTFLWETILIIFHDIFSPSYILLHVSLCSLHHFPGKKEWMDISPGHLAHYCAFLPFCTNTQTMLQFSFVKIIWTWEMLLDCPFYQNLASSQNNRLNLGPKRLIMNENCNSKSMIQYKSYWRAFICKKGHIQYHTTPVILSVKFMA